MEESEVRKEISVGVDESWQADGKDLVKVDGDCGRVALEAVGDCNREVETGKDGNSVGEDDSDGSYVFISRSPSGDGDCIGKSLLLADGSLNHDMELLKLCADNAVALAVKPVSDGSHIILASGAEEDSKGVDYKSIQLVSTSQACKGSPILISSAGDPQICIGVAKTGVVNQESIHELDETCLDSKLREVPELGVIGSDVGNSHVQQSEEINGGSLGSTDCIAPSIDNINIQYKLGVIGSDVGKNINEDSINLVSTCHGQESVEIKAISLRSNECTPPLIDCIKIQYEGENKIRSNTETEKIHAAPLIDVIKVHGDLEKQFGEDHEQLQLNFASQNDGEYPISVSNAGDPQLENDDQESSPELDEICLAYEVQDAPESAVIATDTVGIKEEKIYSGSCHDQDNEEVEDGLSLVSTTCTPLIDDMKIQYEEDSKIGSEIETEKIHIPPLIDDSKVNVAQEEHNGVDHEPIQSVDDVSSPILISNAVDPNLPNDVNKISVTDRESPHKIDETFIASKLIEVFETGVIASYIDNNENDKTNLESTCHGQENDSKDVPWVSTECPSPGIDDIQIQYEETIIGSVTETEKIFADSLIEDTKVNPDKDVIIESDRKIEISKESKSIELAATGRKQPQVEDENKEEPHTLMKEALTSGIRTQQSSDEASQLEHGEENIEVSEKINGDQNFQESSGLEVDMSKEVAKVVNEAGVPAVEGTSNDENYNKDKNVLLDDYLLVKHVSTSPDPALSSSHVENEAGKLNGVKAPLSIDSLEDGDKADLKLEHEIENSSTSNDTLVCSSNDADTDDKKSDVQDGAVNNVADTANLDIQNEETKIDMVEQIDSHITLPSTTGGVESNSNAPEDQNTGFRFVKRPFNYLIKMPRYEDDILRKQIESAHQEVVEKTKTRDATIAEIKVRKVKSQELQAIFESAKSEEKSARGLLKSKRQEIEAVQVIMNKVKNAITVDDIDIRVRGMEHMIQHETLSLVDEKLYIREINQLRHLREQLCSSLGSQEDIQLAFNQKEEAEEHMMILKKELDRLKDAVSKTDEATRASWKKLEDERNKIKELYTLFTSEDDVRQDAFRRFLNVKKRLKEKNVLFRRYKDEEECANGYAASGDTEALNLFCTNQVSKMMGQWNKDDNFRKEYVRCNERSTLRRFGTRDGRLLGPDEEPPIIPKSWDRKSDQSVKKKVKTVKLPVNEGHETNANAKPAEKEQNLKIEIPVKSPISDNNSASKEELVVKEEKPEKTKEEIEMERKAEEEEMAKMKELRKVEEKLKEKEALDRKRRNAEKANVRAELRAQKEAEQREKEKEKKLRKKERKKTGPTDEEIIIKELELSQAMPDSPKTITKGKNSLSPSLILRGLKAATSLLAKRNKSKLTPPQAIRKKKKMQQWLWAMSITILIIILFLLGNIGFYSSLRDRKTNL